MGQVPLLGICLGHQAIALHLGAELAQAKYPMHGKISSIAVGESVLFKCLPSAFDVVRYHSLIIKDWSDVIHPTAFTEDKELMAFDTDPELKALVCNFILKRYSHNMGSICLEIGLHFIILFKPRYIFKELWRSV